MHGPVRFVSSGNVLSVGVLLFYSTVGSLFVLELGRCSLIYVPKIGSRKLLMSLTVYNQAKCRKFAVLACFSYQCKIHALHFASLKAMIYWCRERLVICEASCSDYTRGHFPHEYCHTHTHSLSL